MFKVNNEDTGMTPSALVFVSLILNIFFTPCFSVHIFDFEQVNVSWVR